MLAKTQINQLNPINFLSIKDYSHLLNRIILYTERKPDQVNGLMFNGQKFAIGSPISITIPGHIVHPHHALRKILSTCYERKDILELCNEHTGLVFLYSGYVSVPASENESSPYSERTIVQLKFMVYPLDKIE